MNERAFRVPISVDVMIPDLLMRYPQVRAVLDRYGLRGCGGPNGPRESLRFFAQTHGVDEATLLDELQRAATHRVDDPGAADGVNAASMPAPPALADAIYRPYFLGGIGVILTLGAVWGAWLLWRIGVSGDFHGVSVHEVNAHGHAQIFGWVGLFIMGFALQALPRMWHVPLPWPRVAMAAFAAMVAGIVVRSAAMTAAGADWAVPMAMTGGGLEIGAIIAVTAIVVVAFVRSTVKLEAYMAFILAGFGWFVVQAGFSLWHTWMTMAAATEEDLVWYVATYQAPLRDMQIHGMALFMILGVSIRMLPAMFGVPRIGERRAWWAFVILAGAVVAEIVIFLVYRWTGIHALAAMLMLPWIMLVIGVLMVALPWRLWRPTPTCDRSAKFIRAAYGWLALSLVMLLLLPVYQVVSGIAFSHAYYGSIRHAITVGFISLMIMGIAAKVAPTLTGHEPRGELWLPFVLVNLGCFLRVSTQTLTDWHPAFFWVIGLSGTLEVTGLGIWGVHLARIMLSRDTSDEPIRPGDRPDHIEADHIVANVLTWYPQSMQVFERFGFTMLRNAAVRRTMARRVTLRQAAAMRNVVDTELLQAINGVIHANHCDACACTITKR